MKKMINVIADLMVSFKDDYNFYKYKKEAEKKQYAEWWESKKEEKAFWKRMEKEQ